MNHPSPPVDQRPAPDNPFVTRRVRPGAIPFIFPPGDSLEALLQRLGDPCGWGQIIGPHGSGKSTLLHTLLAELRQQGVRVEFFTLNQSQRRLPMTFAETRRWDHNTQVLVDGYEQLSWWNRWRLQRFCRRRHAGLLVTAHRDMGLPTLYQTAVSLRTAQAVVDHLLHEFSSRITPAPITPDDVAQSCDQHQGNLREALFALYDLYQQRRR